MEYNANGPNLKPLLLINIASYENENPEEFRVLSDGQLAFERALSTLHDVLPGADTIYISVRDQNQMNAIMSRLSQPDSITNKERLSDHDDHTPLAFPKICPILNEKIKDDGSVSRLVMASSKFPDANWLVFVCGYPILPPPALQQLILEFESPITCFIDSEGVIEPLIGIWTPAALKRLAQEGEVGNINLAKVVKDLGGRTITPLREAWLTRSEICLK
jgi:molybdopterin-guanine dinucleotide biosynthesis protein A